MTDRLDATVDTLARLVAFPSVSASGNLEIARWTADRLEAAGGRVHMVRSPCGTKASVFATFGPAGDGGIVLSGHLDVVPADDPGWLSDPFALRETDGRLIGRGAVDMKGFVACVLESLPSDPARLARPLHVALTYDEEVGCHGARQLVDLLGRDGPSPAMAIVGEPTEMRIVDGHKGCSEYTTRFKGRAGHGSDPAAGASAVEAAAGFVARLATLRSELVARAPSDSPFQPPETTVSAGLIAGGTARNVIAASARVEWECRPILPADGPFVSTTMRAFCDEILLPPLRAVDPAAAIETEVIGEVVGFLPRDRNAARDLVSALIGRDATHVVPFGTEAGLWQSIGCDTVVVGPGDIARAHRAEEYITRDELAACLTMLDGLPGALS